MALSSSLSLDGTKKTRVFAWVLRLLRQPFLWTAVDLPQAPGHLCIPAAAAIHTNGRSDAAQRLNCGYFLTKWIPTDDRATGSQARDTDLIYARTA